MVRESTVHERKGPQDTPSLDYTEFDWTKDEARRRVYRVVWRGIPDPFMEALDFPDMGLLAPKRIFSVSSLQSLTLYNNPFVLHASEWMAESVNDMSKEDQVSRLVELCWQRALSIKNVKCLKTFLMSMDSSH